MAYLAVKDGRAAVAPFEPAVGDLLVRGLGEVDAVPAPVVGGVVAGVRPRLAALGRQVEVVLAHARRPAARPRLLLQEPCAQNRRRYSLLVGTVQRRRPATSSKKPF